MFHTNQSHRVLSRPVHAAALLALLSASLMPTALAQDSLPKAEAVLDRFAEVTGSRAAREELRNRVMKATLTFAAVGVTGDLTIYQARPNKQYSVLESEGLGKVEEGTDGRVAWERSMVMGPRIKQGDEKAFALRAADFDGDVNWRKHFKKAECTAVEELDGKPCYKVVLTPEQGRPITDYFDKQSGLLVKSRSEMRTPMGLVSITIHPSDYREVDGVKVPHNIRQVINDVQEMTLTIKSVEHNVDLPADRFDLPADVKALLDRPAATRPSSRPAETP